MKIRTGFVTNSSSSSFILAFKNKESVADELKQENTVGEYGDRYQDLLNDVLNPEHLSSIDSACDFYYDFSIYSYIWNIRKRKYGYDDITEEQEEEVKKLAEEMIQKDIAEIRSAMSGKEFIVDVEYDDHGNYDLEQEIVPNLSQCVAVISHH